MLQYNPKAGAAPRLAYGAILRVGLLEFSETRPLADEVDVVNAKLLRASVDTSRLDDGIREASARVRFAEYALHQAVRTLHAAARTADSGRRGGLARDLFPDGVTPEIHATPRRQLDLTAKLRERLRLCTVPGIESHRDAWLTSLEAAITRLTEAVDGLATRAGERDLAFARELAVRTEHARTIDALMGKVRSLFPGDREKQNLIFPQKPARSRRGPADVSATAPTADAPPTT